jgi:hypothetical protein
VMGLVGPQFVGGAAALGFLLAAEVVAATAVVSESALVYVARGRNLLISLLMLAVQAALTVAVILSIELLPVPPGRLEAWQGAGAAMSLMLALGLASVLKARLLCRLLEAPVQGWRWSLMWATAAAVLVGFVAIRLPEWAELAFGAPLILGAFGVTVWYRGFTGEDRALFRKHGAEDPTLPTPGSGTSGIGPTTP